MGVVVPNFASSTEDRVSGALIVDGGLRFDSGKSHYLSRTPSTVGNRKTWTWSGWVKLAKTSFNNLLECVGPTTPGTRTSFMINDLDKIDLFTDNTSSSRITTTQVFRDYSAWYHIVLAVDTTQATASNRVKIYVNGSQITTFSTATYPSQNLDTQVNNTQLHTIGRVYDPFYANMYLADVHFIDGQALGPEYFGYTDPFTNTWRPKKFSGSFALETASSFTLSNSDFSANNLRSGSNAVTSGVLTDGTLNYDQTFYGNNGANGAYLDIDMTGSSTGELFLVRYWNAAEAGGQTITATCKQVDSGGNDISGTSVSQTWTQGQKWNDGSGYIQQTIQSNTSKIRLIFSGNSNNSFGWGIGEVQVEQLRLNQNSFHLPFDGSAPIGQDQSGRGNNWTPVNFGGSNTIEKATGALPILNTDGGGKVATPGVLGSKIGKTYTVTVPGGTGGGYYLDGIQKPTLNLIRGATYTFDQSDSSNTGHPLVFATIANENNYSDGVTTNGTPGSAGAYTRITVPHNAPDTLYYHCSVHSGMGGSTSQTTDIKKADPYAWKNVLALPLVGIKSDFSNQINSGTTEKVVTNTGTADASTAQSNFYGGSFYFDGTNDYLSIPDNTDFEPGTGDFTIECWIYPTAAGGNGVMIASHGGTAFGDQPGWSLLLRTDKKIQLYSQATPYPGSTNNLISNNTIQLNTWNHIAVTRNGTTQRIFLNGVLDNSNTSSLNIGTTYSFYIGRSQGLNGEYWSRYSGYINDFRFYKGLAKYTSNFIPASTDPDIVPDSPSGVSYSSNVALVPSTDGAVAFDGSGDYLSIPNSSDFIPGTNDFTIEGFFYLSAHSTGDTTNLYGINNGGGLNPKITVYVDPNGTLHFDFTTAGGASLITSSSGTITTGVWYHIAFVRNSGVFNGYVNGSSVGSSSAGINLTGLTQPFFIGYIGESYGTTLNGFVSNFNFINGTALYTSNFTPPSAPLTSTETTKLLCCKSNSSATAADVTPGTITANGNAAATNFNPFTVNINTQRGKQSGYATLNPLAKDSSLTLSNGNLEAVASGLTFKATAGTIYVSSGKWYAEFTLGSGTVGDMTVGVVNTQYSFTTAQYIGSNSNSWGYYSGNGQKYTNGSGSSYGSTFSTSDVIGVALDMDAGTLTFYKNGVSQGQAFTSITGTVTFGVATYSTGQWIANFGQKPFKFPPPAGFQPLTLANTPRPTIVRPDQYVDITTWTGTGAARDINVGWKPDFVWIKERGSTGGHVLYDTVRGATKHLASHSTNGENTDTDALTSFTSNGFSLGSGYTVVSVNGSTRTYVGWSWKAGGNSNTFNIDDVGYATASAAGLTAGTITPTGASVNTKSGFSIIKYQGSDNDGDSVAHGLLSTPSFIIIKDLSETTNWRVWHKVLGYSSISDILILNSTAAAAANNDRITAVDSTKFTLTQSGGSGGGVNKTGNSYIAYSWAEIPGFSKFGSYTGNGSTDGPVIITGFRPKYILVKRTDTTSQWSIWDAARNTYNAAGSNLWADTNETETTSSAYNVDFLSNGFKLRNTHADRNASGGTYIYAAFAETPTFNLYGAQSNAR
jgi:hypothetical protein